MTYKLKCRGCDHNYYTLGSKTWYKSGTVSVCPQYGYCGDCAGGTQIDYTWTGSVVKVVCHGCSNLITVVTWDDWRNRSGESNGYCNGCYESHKSNAIKEIERKYQQMLRQQQEENARRQREMEATLQRQQEENARRQREMEATLQRQREEHARQQKEEKVRRQRELQQQREEHARQLRESQRVSLTALKNEKSAERQRIVTYELSVVQRKIAEIEDKIMDEEKALHKFETERKVEGHQTIAMLGLTGGGKSTLGNRLCGDLSEEADEGPFKTSDDNKSCTQFLKKHIHGKLSVVDCPGWGDSDGNDRTHTNNLCAYLRGCGGINAFVVVRQASNRFDAFFQDQLKYLHSLFGDEFWKHMVVVLTRVDKGGIEEKRFKSKNKAQQFKDDIAALSNGVNQEVAVIAIGLDNYTEALPQILNAIPLLKFECDEIKSPIDTLKRERNGFMDEKTEIQQRIDAISNEIASIESRIAALR